MVLIRIYKIWSELGNMVYSGSTENVLTVRFSKHKTGWKLKSKYPCTSSQLFDAYGVDDCFITEICAVLCETKATRAEIEGSYITHWKERQEFQCVNIHIPGRTKKQWCEDNKCGKRTSYDMFEFPNEQAAMLFRLRWS